MATTGGPNTATDGLVFAFDTTNEKSYKGEPTENIAPSQQMVNHGIGSYNHIMTFSDAPEKGEGWKKVHITRRGSNFRITQMPYVSQPDGATYTYSIEIDWGSTTGYSIRGDGSTGFSITNSTSTNPYGTYTNTSGGNRVEGLFIYNWTYNVDCDDIIYYRHYQVEAKSHPTPFVGGTRSATESLLDQTKNDLIDITDVSFNSDAQIIFDGTDDKAVFNTPHDSSTTTLTYELVFKGSRVDPYSYLLHNNGIPSPNTGNSYCTIGWYNDTPYIYGAFSGKYASMYDSTTPIDPNLYYHVALTWDGEVQRFYINGEEKKSMNLGAMETPISPITSIGGYRNASFRMFDGQVPITRIYTKTLHAEEIKQNFEAIRNKFGI